MPSSRVRRPRRWRVRVVFPSRGRHGPGWPRRSTRRRRPRATTPRHTGAALPTARVWSGAFALERAGRASARAQWRGIDGEAYAAEQLPRLPLRSRKPRCSRAGATTRTAPRVRARGLVHGPALGGAQFALRRPVALRFNLLVRSVPIGGGEDNMAAEREKPMPEAEVNAWLQKNLPKWHLENGWIRRTYKTSGWKGTLMVINTVGHLAEAAWHHPDITASYAWVEVRLMTHTAKGITSEGLRARQEDRGGRALAAGQGRTGRSRERPTRTCGLLT